MCRSPITWPSVTFPSAASANWCATKSKPSNSGTTAYKSWFPGGLDDPNLILMKVDVQQAEYWSATEGRMVQLLGFNKPAIQ